MIRRNKGFIKTILLVVVGLVILKFVFGVTFKDIINSQITKDLIEIVKMILKLLWEAITISLDFLKIALSKAKDFIQGISIK